jgi:RHS repeat-associated protein
MTDLDGVHNYVYDSIYQIINATHPYIQRPTEQFQYDEAGNWLGNGRVHNELNQLVEDDSCWYSYDADGNMTTKVSKLTGDSTIFAWDIENKLIEVTKPGMIARYTYDAFGRRMSKEVNGEKTQFRYDGADIVLEMNGNDSVAASYTFGPGIDNPLVMNRDGHCYYYVKDGLGSVAGLTDSAAAVVKEYKYSAFGEKLMETGMNIVNPLMFTSREYDAETGDYFYRARYYNHQIGRFISADPAGFAGGINLYAYGFNSPTNFADPYGLFSWSAFGKGVGQGAIGIGVGVGIGAIVATTLPADAALVVLGGMGIAGSALLGWNTGQAISGEKISFNNGSFSTRTMCDDERSNLWGQSLAGFGALGAGYAKFGGPFWRYTGPNSIPNGSWYSRGWQAPYGNNYSAAQDALQMPYVPTNVQNTNVPWWQPVAGPRIIRGNEQWGSGGGLEYYRGWTFPRNTQ